MRRLAKIRASCAVIALCYAAKVPEAEAMLVCVEHNFAKDRGMFDKEWQAAAKKLGLRLKPILEKPTRLERFMRGHETGMHIVATHNHLFIVDSGRLYDPHWGKPGLSRKVLQAWKVSKC